MSLKNEHVSEVCCLGKGERCCRYLGMGSDGWQCLKHTGFRAAVDERFAAGQMAAKGDNCEGFAGAKPGSN